MALKHPTKRRRREKVEYQINGVGNGTTRYSRSDSKLSGSSPDASAALPHGLSKLYSTSAHLKLWAVARRALESITPPIYFPEYTGPGDLDYVYRDAQFWTCGFFPGSLHLLLERYRRYPRSVYGVNGSHDPLPHRILVEHACKWWTEELHANATLEGTHDLGFMVMPWARLSWEMNNDAKSLSTIIGAAKTLADRFDPKVGCIRSWDTCQTKVYSFDDPARDFLVIIDNMMNLDLLFYAAQHTQDDRLFQIAKSHATVTQRTHIREDYSTTHVVNFDQGSGKVKEYLTNQGMANDSCWSRGQAWAIAGFAETYHWTGDETFLDTARACADHFLARLPATKIPPWDFDAVEQEPDVPQPPDVSAAMIAAYGMLLIHKALVSRMQGDSEYLTHALEIAAAVCEKHVNKEATSRSVSQNFEIVHEKVDGKARELEKQVAASATALLVVDSARCGDTILNGATINNFKFAPRHWADHGLVYADYFFMLFGNKLLEMGLANELQV